LIIASQAEVERVSKQYKLPAYKISRIFNPLDITRWNPLDRQSCRRILNLSETAHIVVWHGRVEVYSKGLDILLEAWRLLCKARASDDLRLLMVGTGGDAKKLQGLIESLEISGILWVNEFISDQARMVQYLCAADVFTLPSRREGFPIAPLEAMCCGLPIVAADAPGVKDILEDGEESGGIVVPLNDPNALAIALSRVLDDESLRQILGQRGRKRATQYFAPKVIGEQLRNVLLSQSKENSSSDANQ
jgi:glycosyltransferase involved in cell wall biosynthesis